jgi:F-type H+-transporting ATPase subunit a
MAKTLLVLLMFLIAAPSFASSSPEAAHSEESAYKGMDHWSILDTVIPAESRERLRQAWGPTWFEGTPAPDRTMHVPLGILVFFIVLILTGLAMRKLKQEGDEAILPEKTFGLFTFFELISEALLKIMEDTMGKKHARYFFPLIMTLAIFILIGNLMGAVPGLLPATDNLNTTTALAMVVFFVTHIYGVREHGFIKYFAHFCGPIRSVAALPLMILMFVIEIVSHLARPLSLAVRLMGNMVADHKVLSIFLSAGVVLVPLPVMVLGLLVSVVQTLVFCLLSIVYIALAVEHAEEH